MFRYKSIINWVFVGILGIGSFSCSDSFLDQEPQGTPSSATLFADENGAILATNAIYAYLREWNVVGFSYFGLQELPSDDSDVGSTPSDGSFGRLERINTFTYDPSVSELNGYWTGMYNGIARTNQVIYNVPDIEMDETLKARLIAEARTLRAYFYFRLVRAFGDVPLIDKVYDDPVDASIAVPKTTADSIYAFIEADLLAAEPNLPLKSEYATTELGRVTQGTADAFLAKVYLFRQDYVNAKAYALKVIQSGEYSLYPDYRGLFMPDQENGVESILEAQIINTDGQQIENQYAKWQGARGAFGWGFLSPSENLYNSYEAGDPRREATILIDGDSLEGYGVITPSAQGAPPRANKKTMLPGDLQPAGYPGQSPTNYIIMRYADVLLMYAEAANETGETGIALEYVNMVRARARGANEGVLPDLTTTSPDQLRLQIWQERRVELALEGQRFFDIIRQNNVVAGRAKNVFDAAGKTSFDINLHANFPVPLTQIDISNGVLVQDAAWQ